MLPHLPSSFVQRPCQELLLKEAEQEVLYRLGIHMGLAFQLVDDILDVTGSEALLGKPIGSDEEQEKTTFITLFGLDKTKELAEEYTKRALEIADSYEDCDFLQQLTEQLLSRDH